MRFTPKLLLAGCFGIFTFVILLLAAPLNAQTNTAAQTVSGVIVQTGTNEPVPFANVGLAGNNFGTVSNEKGEFELHLPSGIVADSLKVSCIGFFTQSVAFHQLLQGQKIVIPLTPRTYTLQAITILPNEPSALTIVQRALQHIPDNYHTQPYLMDGFYREFFSENSSYVGFAEAAVSIFDPIGYADTADKPAETIKVNQLRVSDLYNKGNYVFYIDLAYALRNNLLRNAQYWQTFARQQKTAFTYIQTDSLTYFDNDLVYCISFEAEGKKDNNYTGRLFIRKADYAVLRLELNAYQPQPGAKDLNGQPYLTRTVTTFKGYEGKLYLNYAHASHDVSYTDDDQQRYYLVFYSELFIHHIQPTAVNPLPENRREKPVSIFYLNRYRTYDPDFWQHYTLFEQSAHNQPIIADLERLRPLKEQYPANGKLKLQSLKGQERAY